MPFFRQMVTMRTRFSPEEVERRLRRIVRKPRTLREVLRRVPANPPQHPDFVGYVSGGTFKLSRLADVASAVGRFQSARPWLRGVITPTAEGSEIRIRFSDPGLSVLAVGLSAAISLVILAHTRAWPLWQIEHLMIIFVVAIALGACRYSLHQDVDRSMTLLRSCLASKGLAP